MLSRREENRLARRSAIVAVARDAFLENGYAATSMSTICSLLGGSKGTLWAYFPSKEDLFAAILDDLTATFRAEMEDALKPGQSLPDALTHFCERFLHKVTTPNAIKLHRLILGEGDRFPEIGPLFYNSGPKQVCDRLSAFLGEQMDAGRLRKVEPMRAANHLIDLVKGPQLQRLWGVLPDSVESDLRAHAESAVDLFLRAYAP